MSSVFEVDCKLTGNMDKCSAFGKEICHKGQHIPLDPPIVHMSVYTKGGLQRLFRQIAHPEKVSFPMYEYGQFTDESGHFCPAIGVVMASRYRVRQVISRQGQSAILLLAEDLFCHKKHVVIKVLHASRYQLGAQETQCLWRLALADPSGNSNTVHYLNTFTFDDHYCIVFKPLVPLSLTDIFRDIPAPKVIHSIRKIAVRLLSTLGFLRQQNVIHADLKPENILLHDRKDLSSVTVIDFGNAIQHVHKEIALYYDDFELQTPLYRAPEVMFGMTFGKEIDMWSLGCILAELYQSKPLFMGNSKMDIMQQITSLLGPFPGRTFQRGKFYSSYQQFTDTVEQPDATELLLRHLGCRDYLLADFLAGLLRYNPDERMTPFEAAKHAFLAPEFPFGYLLPPSSDDGASYCAVHLTDAKYKHRPVVAPDIRRSRPSTYDILNMGTALEEEEPPTEAGDTPNKHGRVAKVVPVQRETSLDKVQRCTGEVTRQQKGARNQNPIDATHRGLSNKRSDQNKNGQRMMSPSLTKGSTQRDKTAVQRHRKEHKYQGEITQPSERQTQRERYQKNSFVKKRREINEKELSAVRRSWDGNDHHESVRLRGNSPNGRCDQPLRENSGTELGRATTNSGSPALLGVRKAGNVVVGMERNNSLSSHSAGERKQGKKSPNILSVREQWSLSRGDMYRRVREETHQEPDDQTEHSEEESEQSQLTTEKDNPTREEEPLKIYHNGREVTPNSHLTGDSDRKSSHPNTHKNRRLSKPGSMVSDLNGTFVIESDNSSPGRSHLQTKTPRQNDQKCEIIRPRPGWFLGKGDSESTKHNPDRYRRHQKATAVSVLTESGDFLNRDTEHALDKPDNSVRNRPVDYLQEINTDSQDQRSDHIKQSKRLEIHGNMKQKGDLCETSPRYTKQKSVPISQSPSSLSQGSLMSQQSDSKRPSSCKKCHPESPRQQTQNATQLASLMNAIREEQDRAEHDLSEREADRQFKFDVDTGTEERRNSRETRFSANGISTSKMYESISEDDFQSFEDENHDVKTETDQNYDYDSSDSSSEACEKEFPTYSNPQKRLDHYEHKRHPAFSASHTNGEEKSFKPDAISVSGVEHWEKKHFHDSSPTRVYASRQVCKEDYKDVHYRHINQKSVHNSPSEIPATPAEQVKHSQTQVICEAGSRRRSGTHTDNDYQHNRKSHRINHRASNNIREEKDCKEMMKWGKGNQNLSKMEGETLVSQKQSRKTFNFRSSNTPNKFTDGDILIKDCNIPASQNSISNNDTETDWETRNSTSASTESAVVIRSDNRAEVGVPATDSTATYPHTSELLERDSCKQVLQSKVRVKKVAKKKLNFTQALKPRKNNKSKIKVLSKSRLTQVTIQHSNKQVKRTSGKGEDPYVFLITPEKNISNRSEENTMETSAGGKRSKKKFSKLVSDIRKKGRNKCSEMDLEDNFDQDLDKEPRTYRTTSSVDEKEREKYCKTKSSVGEKEPRKYRKTKGSLDEKSSTLLRRQHPPSQQTTRTKEHEGKSEETLSQQFVNKSSRESQNDCFFNTHCQSNGMSQMDGERQQPVGGEEKNGQKQKRKAVGFLRTDMKRQKQSDKLDHDNIKSDSYKAYFVKGRNKTDRGSSDSDQGCGGTGRSSYGDVEHYMDTEMLHSENYTTGKTETGSCNSQSKDSEESDETGSWQSSVLYQSGQSQIVAKSSNLHYKSPRKSHQPGPQHTAGVGINDRGKYLSKSSNLVAIGKSRRLIHTLGQTAHNKINSQHKFKTKDAVQLHQPGQSDGHGVYRQTAGTVLQRADLHMINDTSSDCSLGEEACEEFCSSDSEEVMLV